MKCFGSSFLAAGLLKTTLSTLAKPADTPMSPSRRRLPPTPSVSSPMSSVVMPEPVPYYPPGAPHASYSSLSHSMHTSSSSGPPSLSHRTTASSTMSSKNGSRFQYSNGPRSTSDGEKTPISSNEYLPQVSNASYSGGYLSNINETGDDVYRPPKAFPPTANTSYPNQSHLFNPYSEEVQDTNGYEEPEHNQLHRVASYNGFQPPPPPPPVTSQHTASSSEHYLDSSSEYAEADRQVPSRAPQYEYPEAGPSNIGIEDEEDWDPNSYAYADNYDGSEALVPGHEVHRATEMLRSIADYSPRGRLELHDEPQDEYWEDEDEDDESRFVNFSLLSHIAVQLRDKVPRGTHVKGSIPYPRAFTGKDIVVCSS
jgi:RHO1 GDP-GTP exchange protein 1/2